MRMNLPILIIGILMPFSSIVYANHSVNIDCDIKIDIFNVHTTCEQGGVYEQVGILQRRSCEMNIGGTLSILAADEGVFPYSMGVLIARFAVHILLMAVVIMHISYSEKRSGYKRYGRGIWTRRTVYWRQQSISRATYVVLARETRLRRSTENKSFRKGSVFLPSKKVLWRNRLPKTHRECYRIQLGTRRNIFLWWLICFILLFTYASTIQFTSRHIPKSFPGHVVKTNSSDVSGDGPWQYNEYNSNTNAVYTTCFKA